MRCKPLVVTPFKTRPGSAIRTAMSGKYSLCCRTISRRHRPVNAVLRLILSLLIRQPQRVQDAAHRYRSESHVNPTLTKRVAAEVVGTAMLLAAVVGSGIM